MTSQSAQEVLSMQTMSTVLPGFNTTTMENISVTTVAAVGPRMLDDVEEINQVLIPLIVSFGILGNVLSLVVLTRKEMMSPTNCFLIALAVSDLALLLIQIPHFLSFDHNLMGKPSFIIFHRYFTIFRYVLTNVFITCTCWITVAVTIERFISLRFMTHPRLACTTFRAKLAIAGIFAVSILFHLMKCFEYTPNTDVSKAHPLNPTDLVRSKAYDTYVHITNITLTAIIPVFFLIIVNSFLIYFLMTHHRRMRRHRAGSLSTVDMTHITVIVISMVVVFIVCHSFGVFLALVIAVKTRSAVFGNELYRNFKHLNTLLVTTNSSINFLLYSTISKKFRATFSMIFLGKLHDKKLSWSLQNSTNEQTLSTKPNVTTYVSQVSTDSSNGKSGEHSEV